MSTIPKEIIDKIEAEAMKADNSYHSFWAGAELAYQLATDGREELENAKRNVTYWHTQANQVQSSLKEKEKQLHSLAVLNDELVKLNSEKEKECIQQQEAIDRAATIMDEKGKQIFLLNKDLLESLRVNSEQSKQIEELKAENERLKSGLNDLYVSIVDRDFYNSHSTALKQTQQLLNK